MTGAGEETSGQHADIRARAELNAVIGKTASQEDARDTLALLDEIEQLAALAQQRTWERDGAEAILEVESRVRGDGLAADLATAVVRADRAEAERDAIRFTRDERDKELDAALATIAAVREYHRPDGHGDGRCDSPDCFATCDGCMDVWPCKTIRLLDGADTGSDPG